MEIGYMTAVPYIVGCVGMLSIGHLSDRLQKRKAFLVLALVLAAVGLGGAGWLSGSVLAVGAMSVATIGIMGCKGPFWPLPTLYLSGSSAAAGIALINSIGNLGGFFGPGMVGMAREISGGYEGGLYALAAVAVLGAVLTIVFVSDRARVGRSPGIMLHEATQG
jgi:ACS family tartrate transporter-like MFS transporter